MTALYSCSADHRETEGGDETVQSPVSGQTLKS